MSELKLTVYNPRLKDQVANLGPFKDVDEFLETSPLRYLPKRTANRNLNSSRLLERVDLKVANTIVFKFLDRLMKLATELRTDSKQYFDKLLKALNTLATENRITSIFDYLLAIQGKIFPAESSNDLVKNLDEDDDDISGSAMIIPNRFGEIKDIAYEVLQGLGLEEIEKLFKTKFGRELEAFGSLGITENNDKPVALDPKKKMHSEISAGKLELNQSIDDAVDEKEFEFLTEQIGDDEDLVNHSIEEPFDFSQIIQAFLQIPEKKNQKLIKELEIIAGIEDPK